MLSQNTIAWIEWVCFWEWIAKIKAPCLFLKVNFSCIEESKLKRMNDTVKFIRPKFPFRGTGVKKASKQEALYIEAILLAD